MLHQISALASANLLKSKAFATLKDDGSVLLGVLTTTVTIHRMWPLISLASAKSSTKEPSRHSKRTAPSSRGVTNHGGDSDVASDLSSGVSQIVSTERLRGTQRRRLRCHLGNSGGDSSDVASLLRRSQIFPLVALSLSQKRRIGFAWGRSQTGGFIGCSSRSEFRR